MTNNKHTSLPQQWEQRWHAIEQAGGRYQYIMQQMKEHGFLVERKPIDNMSPTERERYKKQLKQEAAEQHKIKKDAWQAYKANHIVYLGHGIYWSDDTSEDKWDATDGAKRLLENQLPTFKNVKALAEQLNLTISQLKGLCFHREVATRIPYSHFTITKRSGGERQIWAPVPRLKYAQRWILDNVLNPMLIHGAAHGFVRGKSIVTNAENHTNSQLIIKMDIKDFFPSIGWRRVKGVFRQAGYPEQIATLFAMLCTESPRQLVKQGNVIYYVALADRCLPQGAPTSPALTNIISLNLDRRLTGLAEKHGLRYSRYADDLTFSLPAEATIDTKAKNTLISTLLGSVTKILTEEGFAINAKKTHIIHQGGVQRITGLVVNGDSVPRVPRNIKRMLRAAIHNLEQGKPFKEGESFNTVQGYAAWIAMAEPDVGEALLQKLRQLKNRPLQIEPVSE